MKGNDGKIPQTGDRRSIRVKTTKMMLKVSMLAVVLCAASAFGGMVKMKGDVENESRRLGELSAVDSETALTEQVEVTAGYLTAVYSSHGSYTPYPVEKPSLSNRDMGAAVQPGGRDRVRSGSGGNRYGGSDLPSGQRAL